MKKQVQAFIASHKGVISSYSGSTKTLHIRHNLLYRANKGMISLKAIHQAIIDKFGFGLPFKLQ